MPHGNRAGWVCTSLTIWAKCSLSARSFTAIEICSSSPRRRSAAAAFRRSPRGFRSRKYVEHLIADMVGHPFPLLRASEQAQLARQLPEPVVLHGGTIAGCRHIEGEPGPHVPDAGGEPRRGVGGGVADLEMLQRPVCLGGTFPRLWDHDVGDVLGRADGMRAHAIRH